MPERSRLYLTDQRAEAPEKCFYDFKGKKLAGEVLDELNYQLMRRLEKEGLISLKELYADGTKIEANVNRYTFVRRDSLNYHLADLLDTIDAPYTKRSTSLLENGYGPKYNLGSARALVTEGMDEARKVIEENRKRKLTKHKKISNNTIIGIDYYSPFEIRKLQKNLMQIVRREDTGFVCGEGEHKPKIQKLYEGLRECGTHLMEHKEYFEIIGKGRNSYSKTGMEATFMRMREECNKGRLLLEIFRYRLITLVSQ